jgi:hypothetical protein
MVTCPIADHPLAAVPRLPNEDYMLEGRVAWDLATALRVDLECVLEEQFRWVIETMGKASRLSGEGVGSDSGKRIR